jgi:hypothetical protein
MDKISVDLISAFKIGLDDGFFNGSYRMRNFDDMTEECFQVYRQGYHHGVDLYIRSMEKQCIQSES